MVLETLPEGTCVHAHCPVFQVARDACQAPTYLCSQLVHAVYTKAMQVVIAVCINILSLQITAEDGYAPLCTFLETILTMLW